jgi:hypothetical protein
MRTLGIVLLLAGCRASPGDPVYPDIEDFGQDTDGGGTGFLPGPDPYQDGEDRLGIQQFYEGDASELVIVDELSTHFYIYENTFSIFPSSDRVEGLFSAEIIWGTLPWFGGGVHLDNPGDISAYDTMHISLKSSDPGMAGLVIAINDGVEARVNAATYGFEPDGDWHNLEVPVADFVAAGLDTSNITAFVLVGEGGQQGDAVLVDAAFFTVAEEGE